MKREKVEVVIHRKTGEIRDSNNYGNDPNPPKMASTRPCQFRWQGFRDLAHSMAAFGGGCATEHEKSVVGR
ncbi:hypothetical protein [Pelomonas sp. CA6]|uniref:hypothetical protein n=1 Tax=Pelomonas sp. CA6 TaxID=2907999 RepID=UPI0035A845F3